MGSLHRRRNQVLNLNSDNVTTPARCTRSVVERHAFQIEWNAKRVLQEIFPRDVWRVSKSLDEVVVEHCKIVDGGWIGNKFATH